VILAAVIKKQITSASKLMKLKVLKVGPDDLRDIINSI
jgi:hypothetical protein